VTNFLKSILRRRSFCTVSALAVQSSLILLAGLGSFLLRFDLRIPRVQVPHLIYGLCAWLFIKTIVFHLLTDKQGRWRLFSTPDLLRLLATNVAASLVSTLAIFVASPHGFPRSIYVSDFVLCLLLTTGARVAVRLLADTVQPSGHEDRRHALVYGAGTAGIMLLRELQANHEIGYKIVGFVDDDPAKVGHLIHGIRVLGLGEDLPKTAEKFGVQHVLVAVPSATSAQIIKILNHCASARLQFRTVPTLSEIIRGNERTTPVRELAVEDLLGRTPVRLEDKAVRGKLESKVVLVTGAGGSIGSELCRQIARFNPERIIGFDVSETALFYLERELRQKFPEVKFEPVIGSVQNVARLTEVFHSHKISTVYHAAAYKHVPMMEAHLFEAVENNVVGTYNLARVAEYFNVEDFVMISSDKAVRPTSIMGLTKRVSEILTRSLQSETTKYVSVRFGNVLGSNGSVVPIFKQQIAAGGPVTVTHKEMRRFFMTIPEAVQLVLQASTMGKGGEIFVLDMGEPVKIIDLVQNMILLSGRRPQDIRIEFTGPRAGEKLYEETTTFEEETLNTFHEKISIFAGDGVLIGDTDSWMSEVRRMCAARDMRLVLFFKQLVTDYSPSAQVLESLVEYPPTSTGESETLEVLLSQLKTNLPLTA
jgi:FlaA1/EpsC-like NDP-sugar epimerase